MIFATCCACGWGHEGEWRDEVRWRAVQHRAVCSSTVIVRSVDRPAELVGSLGRYSSGAA
jgi:hypothetical protein